jgi:outer membrane lipoprotein SlyB
MYDPKHASNDEYTEGYNLGLELGYTDGYYGRPRNAAVPANGAVIAKATVLASSQRSRQVTNEPPPQRMQGEPPPQRNAPPARSSGPLNIPVGTELNLRLTSPIDTKNNRTGDRFTAEVITPGPYDRARIEGHIANINKSGKVTGRTELALAFDSITLDDGSRADIAASLVRIVESETVKEVDEEGNVRSGSRTKDSQVRGGVGAAAGAVIGGIAGGVKGAVLGAIIGGAAGVGTVYIEGNKDLLLDPGTELVIRTERTRAR